MAKPLHFKSAASLSLDELADAFNAAFAGYFYPQQMTTPALARRVRNEQIDLQHSLLAFEGEAFVGIALLGLRGAHGWCGGFGIVPQSRGRGLADAFVYEMLARLRDQGVRKFSLEVLARNERARRLYERTGLRVTRDLLVLARARETETQKQPQRLKEAEPFFLLRHFERLHTAPPAWQRDLPSLLVTDGAHGLYLGESGVPDAYAILLARPEGVTHLIDLAAARSDHANALCARLCELPGILRVVNEPEASLFVAALVSHGFVEADRQHEMACEL